jgi:hypothetical protein
MRSHPLIRHTPTVQDLHNRRTRDPQQIRRLLRRQRQRLRRHRHRKPVPKSVNHLAQNLVDIPRKLHAVTSYRAGQEIPRRDRVSTSRVMCRDEVQQLRQLSIRRRRRQVRLRLPPSNRCSHHTPPRRNNNTRFRFLRLCLGRCSRGALAQTHRGQGKPRYPAIYRDPSGRRISLGTFGSKKTADTT